jgi:hypothetical protein
VNGGYVLAWVGFMGTRAGGCEISWSLRKKGKPLRLESLFYVLWHLPYQELGGKQCLGSERVERLLPLSFSKFLDAHPNAIRLIS